MSLNKILEDSIMTEAFKLHCVEELCSENLFFMLQLKEFKQLQNKKDMVEKADSMFHSFVEDDSEFELNLSIKLKKEMYNIFQNQKSKIYTNIFNGIAFEVEWMLNDCLERFQRKIDQKEEVTSKQFSNRISTVSRKIRRIKGMVSEGFHTLEKERRRISASSAGSISPASSPASNSILKNARNSISKTQKSLHHQSFFEDDDEDEDLFIRDFFNTKEEYNGSFQLSKKTTIVNFQTNSNKYWC
eukprot:gene8616-563_t